LLGLPLDEHIGHVIAAMQGVAKELGLEARQAPDSEKQKAN
jgi:hypothetical protein